MPRNFDVEPFLLSLQVAGLSTLVVVVLGLPAAWILARGDFAGKSLISGLLTLPLVLPPTVVGYALLLVLGKRGPIGAWLESNLGVSVVFHWSGAVVASAISAFPLFLLPTRAALESVDPGLEAAARTLGSTDLDVFVRVTLPLAWRGPAAGAILGFARALGDFGATLMVAGDIPGRTRTASLAIYDAVQTGDSFTAACMSSLIAAVSVGAAVAAQRALGRAARRA
ncbi:MAG: molybdate ABC transporter permease subunit [Isosphaeraceae bacterium]|nr:molybdate ABC transporter permease subunit [Isosphaeraceae bacterium]